MNNVVQWTCDPVTGACAASISDGTLTAIAFVVMAVMFGLGMAAMK